MEILKFNLKGEFAYYRNNEVNKINFTLPHIHKVALMGLFGAILGYKGYSQRTEDGHPEFYQRLKDIKIGISPKKYNFDKKIYSCVNSSCFYNDSKNIVINREYLQDVEWDIYLLLDCQEALNIKESIVNQNFIFNPYLGVKENTAIISGVEIISSEKVDTDSPIRIKGLFKESDFEEVVVEDDLSFLDEEDEIEEEWSKCNLPVSLVDEDNIWKKETFLLCEYLKYKIIKECLIYNVKGENIQFF